MTNQCDMPHCGRQPVAFYHSIRGKPIDKRLCQVHRDKLLVEHWGPQAVGESATGGKEQGDER